MAILKSSSGYSFDTETGQRTNPDNSTTQVDTTPKVDVGNSPITPEQLKTTPDPILPEKSTKLNPLSITLAGAGTQAQSDLEEYTKGLTEQKSTQESDISKIMKDIGVIQGTEGQIAEQYGSVTAQEDINKYSKQLISEQRALELQKRKIIESNPTGSLRGGQADLLNNTERASLQKQADIAILKSAAEGDYDTALQIAKDKVASQILPLQAELDAKKYIYDNNKDLFTKAQGSKLDLLFKTEENKIARQEKTLDTIEQIKLEAAKNGMRNFSGFNNVQSIDEALNLAGSYLKTPNTDVVELDNGDTILVDKRTGAIVKNFGGALGGGASDIPSQFSSVVKLTAALEGTVAGKEKIASDMNDYLKNQDYRSAYNQIVNTVSTSLPSTAATTFSNANTDAEVLRGLREKIVDFENAAKVNGTPTTGLLKGTAEQITRKLGQVKDPALTSLAVQLQREFQAYRVGMTGAAFSPKESRDYASVNPKTTNNFDLNLAVLDGAISQLDNRVNSTVDKKVSGAGDIRKLSQIPEQNAKEVQSNPFLQVSQSIMSVYNPNQGWIIPGQSN